MMPHQPGPDTRPAEQLTVKPALLSGVGELTSLGGEETGRAWS